LLGVLSPRILLAADLKAMNGTIQSHLWLVHGSITGPSVLLHKSKMKIMNNSRELPWAKSRFKTP
jgi:hypothetical protein